MGDPVSQTVLTVGKICLAVVFLAWLGQETAIAREEKSQEVPKKTFIVREYRFEPQAKVSEKEAAIGLSLCSTRCNALSGIYGSYIKPRGWRLIKTVSDLEKIVDLDNPFLEGKCVCLGDEFSIDWYDPVAPENRAGAKAQQRGNAVVPEVN